MKIYRIRNAESDEYINLRPGDARPTWDSLEKAKKWTKQKFAENFIYKYTEEYKRNINKEERFRKNLPDKNHFGKKIASEDFYNRLVEIVEFEVTENETKVIPMDTKMVEESRKYL